MKAELYNMLMAQAVSEKEKALLTLNLLSEYVQELDSVQREFLEERLPDNLQILLEPQKIDPDEFENIKGSLKTYLQGGRLPGFNGKALLPQAASLCRTGLG